MVNVIYFSPNFFTTVCPRWYLTSPEYYPWFCSPVFSKNSLKICWAGLSKTQWRVFKRPLWAIPRIRFFAPNSAEVSASCSRAHVAEFSPSIPNLLKFPNLLPKKSMKDWSLQIRSKAFNLSSFEGSDAFKVSIFASSCKVIKSRSSRSRTWVY